MEKMESIILQNRRVTEHTECSSNC